MKIGPLHINRPSNKRRAVWQEQATQQAALSAPAADGRLATRAGSLAHGVRQAFRRHVPHIGGELPALPTPAALPAAGASATSVPATPAAPPLTATEATQDLITPATSGATPRPLPTAIPRELQEMQAKAQARLQAMKDRLNTEVPSIRNELAAASTSRTHASLKDREQLDDALRTDIASHPDLRRDLEDAARELSLSPVKTAKATATLPPLEGEESSDTDKPPSRHGPTPPG